MDRPSILVVALAFALAGAGCSGVAGTPDVAQPVQLSKALAASNAVMYVASASGIGVYDTNTGRRLRTITQSIDFPLAAAVDAAGTLYVANGAAGPHGQGTVQEYARGTGKLLRVIRDGLNGPFAFAFDGKNDLYVASQYGGVTVYAPGSTGVMRRIGDGVSYPVALAFDGSGNLFVCNSAPGKHGWISEYPPGATTASRVIRSAINTPLSISVDAAGNLYVANLRGNSITVYAPGATAVTRRLERMNSPETLVMDSAGTLYAGSFHGIIRGYANASAQSVVIHTGIDNVRALAIDPMGNVVAADYGRGTSKGIVTVWDPANGKRVRRITDGVLSPTAVVFGPQ